MYKNNIWTYPEQRVNKIKKNNPVGKDLIKIRIAIFSYFTLTLFLFLFFLSGCGKPQYLAINRSGDLQANEGKNITVDGIVSNIIWQHLIGTIKEYPNQTYFDFDNFQTVLYSKDPIQCKDKIRVKGKVVKISGKSKKPGSDEDYYEYHIQVDEWICLD